MKRIPLREKKHAQTKVALAREFTESLKKTRYEQISIAGLCRKVQICEATFYNYFSQKLHLVAYALGLLEAGIVREACHATKSHAGLRRIEEIFIVSSRVMRASPLFNEFAAIVARETLDSSVVRATSLELRCAFGDYFDFPEHECRTFEALFEHALRQAVAQGALPRHTDISLAVESLGMIMVGTPLIRKGTRKVSLEKRYLRHLGILWKGLRHGN